MWSWQTWRCSVRYIYVYVYICICVCVCVYKCVYIYIYTHPIVWGSWCLHKIRILSNKHLLVTFCNGRGCSGFLSFSGFCCRSFVNLSEVRWPWEVISIQHHINTWRVQKKLQHSEKTTINQQKQRESSFVGMMSSVSVFNLVVLLDRFVCVTRSYEMNL